MGEPKTSETLDALFSEVNEAEKPGDDDQKESSGLLDMLMRHDGSVLDSGFSEVEDARRNLCNGKATMEVVESRNVMEVMANETLGVGADHLLGNGNVYFGCGGSYNGSLLCEAVAQTQMRLELAESHLTVPHERVGEHGMSGEEVEDRVEVSEFEKTASASGAEEDGASLENEVDSAKRVEVFGDGISLLVDFCVMPSKVDQNNVDILGLGASEIKRENVLTEEAVASGKGNYKFSVGDIIWVKTKAESWWPAQICDPKIFPNYAADCPQIGCSLVGYFGIGNFAWCNSSQMKPFFENFEEISREAKSRNFKVAVEKAVNEFGRRVKLKTSCACIAKGGPTAIASDLAASNETYGGCSTTDFMNQELSIRPFDPKNILEHVKLLSLEGRIPSMLHLKIAQCHLSAFYSSLGHSNMPMHILQGVAESENTCVENLGLDMTDNIGGENQNPIENLPCALESNGNGSRDSVLLNDQTKVSGNDVLKRTEDKILLMESGGNTNNVLAGEVTISGDMTRNSQTVGMPVDFKAVNNFDTSQGLGSCKSGHSSNEDTSSRSLKTTESKVSSQEDGGVACKSGFSSNEDATMIRSLKIRESKLLSQENGGGGKAEKGFELRERKKSKYLSPPYVNLSFGRKSSNVSEDHETEDGKGDSHSGSPPIVKCCCKKKKSWSKSTEKFAEGSSAELLSALQYAALDCRYKKVNMEFDRIESFFYRFRSSMFRDSYNCELCNKHKPDGSKVLDAEPGLQGTQMNDIQHHSPAGKSEPKKRKRKQLPTLVNLKVELAAGTQIQGTNGKTVRSELDNKVSDIELLSTKLIAGMPGANGISISYGPSDKDLKGPYCYPSTNVGSGQMEKKREPKNPLECKDIVSDGLLDVGVDVATNSSLFNVPQGTTLISFNNIPEEGKEGSTFIPLEPNLIKEMPDLKGNSDLPTAVVEDATFMGFVAPKAKLVPKKKKASEFVEVERREDGVGSESPNLNHPNAKEGFGGIPMQSIQEGRDTAGPSLTNLPGGIDSGPCSFANNSPHLCSLPTVENAEVKKRKRKKMVATGLQAEQTGIPDVIGKGDGVDPLGPETSGQSSSVQAEPKRRRRRRRRGEANKRYEVLELHTNLCKTGTSEEAPGTALLLVFAPEYSLPYKEDLIEKFCVFGPLVESETQVLKDSASAQVVFIRSSDAGDAFRSLEKTKPFGPALVNFKLINHSGASRALEPGKEVCAQSLRSTKGLVISAKPSCLTPQLEAPSLSLIRQNLKMMTSMLEKSGNNLSADMRAKLEGEIKGLMRKVSTLTGSTS